MSEFFILLFIEVFHHHFGVEGENSSLVVFDSNNINIVKLKEAI